MASTSLSPSTRTNTPTSRKKRRAYDDFSSILHEDFSDILHEIDRYFDSILDADILPSEIISYLPDTDVQHTEGYITITVELPGVNKEDIDISVSDNILTVKGEKKSERQENEGDYSLTERYYGKFSRSFSLPSEVSPDQVSAEFSNGILTINIEKSALAQENIKKIEVR